VTVVSAALPANTPAPARLPTEPAPELVAAAPPNELSQTPGAAERTMVIGVKDAQFAQVRVGPWVGWMGGVYGRDAGAYVRCGRGAGVAPFVPARWEALRIRAEGAEYSIADGWFDRAACRATTSRRTSADVRPIGRGGVVFAARSCEATPCDKPNLMLLMPRAQSVVASGVGGEATKEVGAFTRVTLPLRRGGGGSVMARVAMPDLLAWRGSRPKEDPQAKAPVGSSFVASVLIGVEVVQGVDDPQPIAVIYQDPPDV